MATQTQYYNLDKPSYDEVADIEIINANFDKIDQQMRNNADGVNFAKAISSDAYDNSKLYAVGDYCIYDNKLYRCITAIESAEAFTIAKWEQTTVGKEVKQLNSNLGAQGLIGSDNIEMLQGFPSNTDITQTFSSNNYVCSKGYFECNAGDKITIHNENSGKIVFFTSAKGELSEVDYPCVAPTNAKYFRLKIGYKANITPTNCGNVSVYINNAIDELKNDLATKNITSQLAYNKDVVSDLIVLRTGNVVEVYFVVNADSNKLNIISGLPKSASRYSMCPVFNNVSPYKPVDASVWISNNIIHLYTSSQITDGSVSLKYICE